MLSCRGRMGREKVALQAIVASGGKQNPLIFHSSLEFLVAFRNSGLNVPMVFVFGNHLPKGNVRRKTDRISGEFRALVEHGGGGTSLLSLWKPLEMPVFD